MTEDEQRARVERELEIALGKFDEMLSREATELADREPTPTTFSRASSGGGAGGGGAGAGSAGQSGGGGNRSEASSGGAEGEEDDIVARQLREAAETETDPELRRKLWEEYRAYKGIGGPPDGAERSGEPS
jgi:hypothetical protein